MINIEGMAFTGLITIISLLTFIFWTKKKALINFRAWALLTALINIMFFFNECQTYNSNRCFDLTTIFSLYLIQFITTLIIMFKLWKLSNRYIPKGSKLRTICVTKQIQMKVLALGYTVKNGGNSKGGDNKIKSNLKKIINN